MILRQLGSNQTELSLNNGDSIFFSYETPVAGLHQVLDAQNIYMVQFNNQ